MILNKKKHKFEYRNKWTAYLFLLPAVLFLTVFVWLPLVMAVFGSFIDFNTNAFVGWDNYLYVFREVGFLRTFLNAGIFTVAITALMLLLSFFFAHCLKSVGKHLSGVTKFLVYIPYFFSPIVASVIFTFLVHDEFGLFNNLSYLLIGKGVVFAEEGIWPYLTVILPTIWIGFGYNSLIMFAGLLNIPKEYYEAAALDGAGGLKKLWYVTIPNMKNYFLLLLVGLITSNMQLFEMPLMLTQGGPNHATETPMMFLNTLYRTAGKPKNSVLAGSLMVMLLLTTINMLLFYFVRSDKSRDD